MKKTQNTRLAALGLAAALLVALAGCSEQTAVYEGKSYTLPAEQVTSLTIEARDRSIEVLPSQDGQVHITYYESDKEFYTLEVSDSKALTMTCADAKEWGDYVGGKAPRENRSIQVYLPDGALKDLALSTTNETVTLSRLTFGGTVEIGVNGGDLALEEVAVGTAMKLDAKNGNISGTVAGAYGDFSIESTVKKGKSNLPEYKESGAKKLTASVNNGDLAIEFSN